MAMLFRFLISAVLVFTLAGCNIATFNSAHYVDITVYWSAPIERVNGDAMAFTEVGGYELRYRLIKEKSYRYILITDPAINQYVVRNVDPKNTIIEVAVFDTEGIYSDFIKAVAK